MNNPSDTLVVVFGDQLSLNLSSLQQSDKANSVILMAEVAEETVYVKHHKKKIAFIFSAMRHMATRLRDDGWQVRYVELEDAENTGSFTAEIKRAVDELGCQQVRLTEPSEWRVLDAMRNLANELAVNVNIVPDTRFVASHEEFASWASGRKQLRMEYFYRDMRRKTGLLMDGDQPVQGRWNFDADNRNAAEPDLFMPQPLKFEPDAITRQVLELVERRFADHFGDLEPFWFGVTAEQADQALEHFVSNALAHFGDYQDAMLEGEEFLYHSVLSHYINVGLLDPLAVCRRVAEEYERGRVPINAAEGYIRQIIGWREYVRGIYWLHMPEYVERNFFEAERDLPSLYWTGETPMACLRAAVGQTRRQAYAHHIQRLMVTGNFAMLIGVEPRQVHEWYLAVYTDAFEWVELPNTLGMSQFGDGGLLGSKPYASSGNYINKMSNHCSNCQYDVKKKTGEKACPFNALYWDFLARNEAKLASNPRLGQIYATWRRMSPEKQQEYRESAATFLGQLD
ncbi:MAG: cryptochrome/photolyase family protein [Rhizobiaceae bacterium]|nr:cryptochrome/photolyase family protein [Hyphomicrobiales bacterium]NRB29154.1 cryptochrome/photolyase family protein [Rhizobiaceae bacterium]